ncbi:MAG: TIGR01777 family oxidoreductase [Ardenticatenaceae bacterium]|nr:TIGR01777 family oxidoreductase [Ardenticatenaceae bacterium]
MRVLITGGSGLIGRALTPYLTAKNYEVIILSRHPQRVKGLPEGASAVEWDGKSADGWGHLADGAKAIINLAGAGIADKRWTPERKRIIVDSRISAAQAVIEAVEKAAVKPELVIQSSAVGFYGDRGDETATESSAAGSGFLADVCVKWEEAAKPLADLTRLVTIRTGVVLTTTGGALPQMMLPFKFFAGGPLGGGKQWVPWIHLDDEVRAISWLIENEDAAGVYNLSAPNIVRNKELVKIIGQALGRPSFAPAPAFALKLALGEMAAVVLESQKAIPAKLQEEGFEFQFPYPAPALKDLIYNKK